MRHRKFVTAAGVAIAASLGATSLATAADLAAPLAPPPTFANGFFSGIEFHAQGDAGILGNSLNPSQGLNREGYNFGTLTTDHANTPQLNQILLTVSKSVDAKETGYAFGFTIQGLYGSDERFFHYIGIGDQFLGTDRNQLGVLQAYVNGHLPLLTAGGIDVKVGLFLSPQGYETLDPSTSPFYSHSYTYFYGDTFNHTGILTTTHVNPKLDIYAGVDTGNQTSIGYYQGDPNGKPAGFVGFGLNNLLNDKLTVLALSHIGPEQPYPSPANNFGGIPNAGSAVRFYNDAVFTYKATDALVIASELNYSRDDYGVGNGPATFYSAAGYLGYTFNKIFTFNARAEVARDSQNFFVLTPQQNSGFAKSITGATQFPSALVAPNGTQGTTYGEITLGFTIKPDVPKPLALVLLRPEVRFDQIIAGGPAYNNTAYRGGFSGSRNEFTFGGDVVIGF